ncbi:hypothetical protein F751_1824 [Auxenochlorella protothecoides]|uniref:Uncharacterized protein n=1 Tax=Auxenochlorella protothecoides TaxID=3075 RepID=A0A087SGU1_AUXPR|nr:hypothetical protein F751_1824 [Auxenochlorella protothecoides]KFM24945.1 hypothetical protein F751_1824 [Auxenochlorella protothecoides]
MTASTFLIGAGMRPSVLGRGAGGNEGRNLGCSNLNCPLCKTCQRRRCEQNFASKYLAPCDVLEAKCGAQIYVVVVDAMTGQLVHPDIDDPHLQICIVDGRRFEQEGEREEALESCMLLVNKQGQPLLSHGRSGTFTDEKRIMVPLILGQAMLPDLKVTDSSEALLLGRAPPFRLLVRLADRLGHPCPGVKHALSEPFVVATARVKGAAKADIPHVDDHVSKIECVGVQTQRKLEDIAAAGAAAGVADLRVPVNCVTRVGQFRELVELAEGNKPLRETLKQVLRLTKGWDVARDHVRRCVDTDERLRVFHPDGRTDVGLAFRCAAHNVVDLNRPLGLLRRRQNPAQPNQEMVDVIWLPQDAAAFPEAVRRLLPQAFSACSQSGTVPGPSPLSGGRSPAGMDYALPLGLQQQQQGGVQGAGAYAQSGPGDPARRLQPAYGAPSSAPEYGAAPPPYVMAGSHTRAGGRSPPPSALGSTGFAGDGGAALREELRRRQRATQPERRARNRELGADTSLEAWMAMHKSLDVDLSLPPNLAQMSNLFPSLLPTEGSWGGAYSILEPAALGDDVAQVSLSTMSRMQAMFQAALRQEIPYSQLEEAHPTPSYPRALAPEESPVRAGITASDCWAGDAGDEHMSRRTPSGRAFSIIVAVCVTLLVDNWLRGAFHLLALEHIRGGADWDTLHARPSPLGGEAGDTSTAPGWKLPAEYKAQIVVAVPLSPSGRDWIKAGRAWRRGLRAAYVADFNADAELRLDGGLHGEEFIYLNSTDIPFHYYGKAAMVPSVAHEHFGQYNYKWMLYGDDDTIWFLDSVVNIVKGLDPDMPHLITDHLWFWGHTEGSPSHPVHPAADAPRCLPCGYNTSLLAGLALPFDPPLACPFCTWQKLCAADVKRRSIYGDDCGFRPRYPPEAEFLAHGGGGIILSVGLMRMLSVDYMRIRPPFYTHSKKCIGTRFKPGDVFGGDTLFSHCAFFTGVAPTDPGYYFQDPEYNAFDQGGQLLLNSVDLMYSYLKRSCCNAQCEARLAALTTLHARGMHFKEPSAAMDTARLIIRLREMYLAVREEATKEGRRAQHEEVPPSWDNHKKCY